MAAQDFSLEIALLSSLFGLEPESPQQTKEWFAVGFGNHESDSTNRGKYLAVKYYNGWLVCKCQHISDDKKNNVKPFEEAIKVIPALLKEYGDA